METDGELRVVLNKPPVGLKFALDSNFVVKKTPLQKVKLQKVGDPPQFVVDHVRSLASKNRCRTVYVYPVDEVNGVVKYRMQCY
jgi:hypothetical protein